MRKILSLILVFVMSLLLCSCGKSKIAPPPTEEELKAEIEAYLEPQIAAYKKTFGIDDLTVDIQFKKLEINKPLVDSDGDVYCNGSIFATVRDIMYSPSVAEKLLRGEFTDELLRQLSIVEFDYSNFKHEDYTIILSSRLAVPIFKDNNGNEYTISDSLVLKDDIICYITTDAQLVCDAKVGDNVNAVLNEYMGSLPSGNGCPHCNGSGYVKYYYGSSDLEAYLDGYDPYTVGKCTSCN